MPQSQSHLPPPNSEWTPPDTLTLPGALERRLSQRGPLSQVPPALSDAPKRGNALCTRLEARQGCFDMEEERGKTSCGGRALASPRHELN